MACWMMANKIRDLRTPDYSKAPKLNPHVPGWAKRKRRRAVAY